jgi:hypothetical protein
MKEVPPRAQDTGEGPRSEPEEDTRQQYDPDEATRQAKVLIAQWLASPDPDWTPPVLTRADLDALDADIDRFIGDGCPNDGDRS